MLKPVESFFSPIKHDQQGIEWIDSWTASNHGAIWFTPEEYHFYSGDTINAVVFLDFAGGYLKRTDLFSKAGEKNPYNYLMSNTTDEFLPPPPPNYGWLCGVSYIAPSVKQKISLDWASRINKLWCGMVPLSGRPSTFSIEP